MRFGVETFVSMIAPKAYIRGFKMLDLGGFPGLVQLGDDAERLPKIRGEVHEYKDLTVLDQIEGYHQDVPEKGLYTRIQLTAEEFFRGVRDHPIEIEDCWVYIFNRAGGQERVIQSSDWFEHRGLYAKSAEDRTENYEAI